MYPSTAIKAAKKKRALADSSLGVLLLFAIITPP